jgi:hypothetical protein
LWYHDVLSLMTCKKSVQYMKEKRIFDNWLLPWGRLQEGTRYHESIPGDSPEPMSLDETLNMDNHASARYHVAITSHLPNDDPRKYSFSTPKEISRAYLRLVDPATGGAPSLTRIVQDCDKLSSGEMVTENAAMTTNGEATKQKTLEARQNGYTLMLQA